MSNVKSLSVSLFLSASAVLAAGAACAQQAPAPAAAPQPAPAASAAPSAAQSVAFSARLVSAASAFDAYMRTTGAMGADFKDGAQVRRAVMTGAAYEPHQMVAGQVAFAAIVALQDPAFVQGARELARDQRALDALLANPAIASTLPGAEHAAAAVSAALRARGDGVFKAGSAVKQSAYDVQHQSWSLGRVPDPQAVLAESKSISAGEHAPAAAESAVMIKAAFDAVGGDFRQQEVGAVASPVIQRGLALAAMAVAGRAGDGQEETVASLLNETAAAQCVKMAKLNLYQCLSVAGPHYEDLFCLGQHAMMDTGQCVIAAAAPAQAAPPAMQSMMQVATRASWGGPSQPVGSLIPVAQMASTARPN